MANPLAQASGMPQSMQQTSTGELGSGWRCVKSEDFGQTYIFGARRGQPGMPTCALPALLLCLPPARRVRSMTRFPCPLRRALPPSQRTHRRSAPLSSPCVQLTS